MMVDTQKIEAINEAQVEQAIFCIKRSIANLQILEKALNRICPTKPPNYSNDEDLLEVEPDILDYRGDNDWRRYHAQARENIDDRIIKAVPAEYKNNLGGTPIEIGRFVSKNVLRLSAIYYTLYAIFDSLSTYDGDIFMAACMKYSKLFAHKMEIVESAIRTMLPKKEGEDDERKE